MLEAYFNKEELSQDDRETLLSRCAFVSGDWATLDSAEQFDLVIMGDTIYEPKSYPALYSYLRRTLSDSGVCVVSA